MTASLTGITDGREPDILLGQNGHRSRLPAGLHAIHTSLATTVLSRCVYSAGGWSAAEKNTLDDRTAHTVG